MGARISHQRPRTREEILERAWTNPDPIAGELPCARRTSWATPTYSMEGMREKGQKGWREFASASEVLGPRAAKRRPSRTFHCSSKERRIYRATQPNTGTFASARYKKELSPTVLRGHKGSQSTSFLYFSCLKGLFRCICAIFERLAHWYCSNALEPCD